MSLRTADYVSVFPSGVTIAASWDKSVMYERNIAMGQEFKAKGAHVALALDPFQSIAPTGRRCPWAFANNPPDLR